MGAMFGNLDHAAELEAPSVRAGRLGVKHAGQVWLEYDSFKCSISTLVFSLR